MNEKINFDEQSSTEENFFKLSSNQNYSIVKNTKNECARLQHNFERMKKCPHKTPKSSIRRESPEIKMKPIFPVIFRGCIFFHSRFSSSSLSYRGERMSENRAEGTKRNKRCQCFRIYKIYHRLGNQNLIIFFYLRL